MIINSLKNLSDFLLMVSLLSCLSVFLFMLSFLSWNTSENRKQGINKYDKDKKYNKDKRLYAYSIDTSRVSILWTSYKLTNKAPVSGTFKDFYIEKKNVSGSVESILNSLKLTISTSSIDSKNAIRDFQLNTYFSEIFNASILTSTIINAENNEGLLLLKMNERSQKVSYTYTFTNDTIKLFTHLDLNRWNGGNALNTLDKTCYNLYKGADGISKLWPDVDINIKLPLTKTA